MARVITLEEAQKLPKGQIRDWAYNALDCTGTREVADVLLERLNGAEERIYNFCMAVSGPGLSMQRRGVRVDLVKRDRKLRELQRELKRDLKALGLHPTVKNVWDGKEKDTGRCSKASRKDGKHKWTRGLPDDDPGKRCEDCGAPRYKPSPFNPGSPVQCWHLFHDLFGVPKTAMRKKDGKYGVDEDVLHKLMDTRERIADFCGDMLACRKKSKQIGFLKSKLTADNRFPSTFNVGGAWTGRFSSSKDHHMRGANLQNIAEQHRDIFVADAGMELCYADYKQAESYTVAHLAGDERYIEAHDSGDAHTYVTRLVWPDLPWTGDLAADKKIAGGNPDWDQAPGHSFRFQAKRIQHGSNYGLTPYGISRIAHIPQDAAESAQANYFDAFPGIPAWHGEMKQRIEEQQPLTNPFGRRVRLFGRPWDPHTFKQGLAFVPQSTVVDLINTALWRIWRLLEAEGLLLLGQVHDALLWEHPKGEEALVRKALELMTVRVPVLGADGQWRDMVIGVEAAIGRNWGKRSEDNPYGIKEIEI